MSEGPPVEKSLVALVALYDEAARRIRVELLRVALRGQRKQRQQLSTQLVRIDRILTELRAHSHALAPMVIRDVYRGALRWLDSQLGVREQEVSLTGIHRNAVAIIAQELDGRLENAVRTVGRRADDLFRRVGLEESGISLIRNLTPQQSTKAIQQRLVHEGVTAFVDRAGRRWKLDVYASMVAATTTREAQTVATVNRMYEQGHDLISISHHRHEPDICDLIDGKTFSLSGNDPRYPKAPFLPPAHPRCRHVVLPAKQTLEDARSRLEQASSREEVEAALGIKLP